MNKEAHVRALLQELYLEAETTHFWKEADGQDACAILLRRAQEDEIRALRGRLKGLGIPHATLDFLENRKIGGYH